MKLNPGRPLSALWNHITMSLNDPQWGRKPSDKPVSPENNGQQGGERPSPPPPPSAPTPPSPPPSEPPRSNGGGGKKPNSPPDLDDLFKNVSEKINDMLNGAGKNPRRPNGEPSGITPKFAAVGALFFGVGAIGLWLASGFYQITEGERGLVQRFGKYSSETGPGLNWHLPWPMEAVRKVNMSQVRSVDIGFRGSQKNRDTKQAQMLTEDLNIIDITFSVQYSLSDAKAYLFNHRKPDDAVTQAAETAMREIVGKRKMDFLLNQGREEFAAATQKLMQVLLDRYGTGIRISKLNLQTVAAPDAVNEAFQDVVKAQQDRDRLVNEGQAYANRVVPEARGRAARLLEEASGYEQSVVARAQGDAARFTSIVSEYNKAPGVTRERLYIDMMQSVLGNTSKVLVDQKQGQSLLYLPLDKLVAGTRDAANAYGSQTLGGSTEPVRPVTEPAATPPPAESSQARPSGRDSGRTGRETRNETR